MKKQSGNGKRTVKDLEAKGKGREIKGGATAETPPDYIRDAVLPPDDIRAGR